MINNFVNCWEKADFQLQKRKACVQLHSFLIRIFFYRFFSFVPPRIEPNLLLFPSFILSPNARPFSLSFSVYSFYSAGWLPSAFLLLALMEL